MGCKKADRCIQKDDLTPALDRIVEADAIIIGSPIYISAETATTKALIDRFYSFLASGGASGQYTSRMPKGKKGAMLFTCGNPQGIELYSPVIARYQNQFQRHGIDGVVVTVPSTNPGMKVLETPRGQKALEDIIQHVSMMSFVVFEDSHTILNFRQKSKAMENGVRFGLGEMSKPFPFPF